MIAWPRLLALSVLAGAATTVACLVPPRMCAAEGDCASGASCVAGRCVARGATQAVLSSRRWVLAPLEVGWVRRGDEADRRVATLGRGDGAVVFLRFDVPIAPEAHVIEAYLVFSRAPGLDADPGTLILHAADVAGAWDPRSLSWARQPSMVEVGAPTSNVATGSDERVRLDVRGIVERWRQRRANEYGVAIVADGRVGSGFPVALEPQDVPSGRGDPVLGPTGRSDVRPQIDAPILELYVH